MAIITTGSMPKALVGKEKVKPMKPLTGKKGPKLGRKKVGTASSAINKMAKMTGCK